MSASQVRLSRERLKQQVAKGIGGGSGSNASNVTAPTQPGAQPPQQQVFLAQLTALSCSRNVRTRRLAQAEENPEMTKTARLACIFKDLYNSVINAKGFFPFFFSAVQFNCLMLKYIMYVMTHC